ncbi:MAG: hypothetical protein NC409_07090 [Clostridium sp.]|nr:hypothetical protein [Clostridium sp.]
MTLKRIARTLLAAAFILSVGAVSCELNASAASMRELFDADYYASTYPDVGAAFGNDEEALWNHFITYGLAEGRSMNALQNEEQPVGTSDPGVNPGASDLITENTVSTGIGNQTFCAGTYFSAFIKDDNSLWTCGGSGWLDTRMYMGEAWLAGNWLQGSNGLPVKIMDDARSVYTNGDMTCYAVKTDGSLWVWGENNGAFGNGSLQPSKIPVRIMDHVVYVVSKKYSWSETGDPNLLYGYVTIALTSDGTLWGWGTNHWGELGDGTYTPHLSPVKIMDHVTYADVSIYFTQMSVYAASTYALKTDGTLWAWGHNHAGQLGIGTIDSQPAPAQVTDNVRTFYAQEGACAIIKNDGSYWQWGSRYSSTQSASQNAAKFYFTRTTKPQRISDNVSSVTASDTINYFLRPDNSLWAWGNAPALDLTGSGQSFVQSQPIPLMDSVRSIHHGSLSTFAIRTDNTLWGWGANSYGQIGMGVATNDYQANPVPVMEHVLSVYTANFTTYILRTDGTLWGCGDDSYCQLGQGQHNYQRPTPVMIADHVRMY